MKKKFSTKTIVISALIVVLLAVGITGTVVFLKDSGEAEAAMEEQENLLPVTGRDDETEGNNEQVEPNEETEGEQDEYLSVDEKTLQTVYAIFKEKFKDVYNFQD